VPDLPIILPLDALLPEHANDPRFAAAVRIAGPILQAHIANPSSRVLRTFITTPAGRLKVVLVYQEPPSV
jgi:hypothetical protein